MSRTPSRTTASPSRMPPNPVCLIFVSSLRSYSSLCWRCPEGGCSPFNSNRFFLQALGWFCFCLESNHWALSSEWPSRQQRAWSSPIPTYSSLGSVGFLLPHLLFFYHLCDFLRISSHSAFDPSHTPSDFYLPLFILAGSVDRALTVMEEIGTAYRTKGLLTFCSCSTFLVTWSSCRTWSGQIWVGAVVTAAHHSNWWWSTSSKSFRNMGPINICPAGTSWFGSRLLPLTERS